MDVDDVRRRFLEDESISSIARDVGRTPRRVQQVVADLQTTRPVPPPEIMDSLLVVMMRMHGPSYGWSYLVGAQRAHRAERRDRHAGAAAAEREDAEQQQGDAVPVAARRGGERDALAADDGVEPREPAGDEQRAEELARRRRHEDARRAAVPRGAPHQRAHDADDRRRDGEAGVRER